MSIKSTLSKDLSRNTQFFLLAALALLVIHLLSFAVISPLNVENADYWYYPYQAKRIFEQGDWFYTHANRQFAMAGLALSHMVLPDRLASMHYTHLVFIYVTALGLFFLFQRLMPRYKLFAFLLAAVFLLYSPFNNAVILHWLNPYSWAGMLSILATIALVEGSELNGWRRWSVLLFSGVLAYVATRAYESALPLLVLMPLLVASRWRKINRDLIIIALIWWAFTGWGMLEFAVPYLSNDPSTAYQSGFRSPDEQVSLEVYAQDSVQFMENAFPLRSVIFNTPLDYLAPAVLLSGIVLASALLFQRRFPEWSELPLPSDLLLLLVTGLVITFMGGFAFIYAGNKNTPYSTYFGSPGQALVVLCVLALAALASKRLLKINASMVLLSVLMVYFVVAAHWHYEAQVLRVTFGTPFDKRISFYQELASFAPQLEPNSLILHYNCADIDTPEDFRLDYIENVISVRYLYGYIDGSQTVGGGLLAQAFDETGVVHDPGTFPEQTTAPKRHYNYDQMVLVECTSQGLHIMDRFPDEFAPDFPATDTYNPYARIRREFIPADNARILAP